jgi:CRP-like cAMP-binding protein
MSEQVMQQVYTQDEIIYDAGEMDCDALYFVQAGKVKVEAKFSIENRH